MKKIFVAGLLLPIAFLLACGKIGQNFVKDSSANPNARSVSASPEMPETQKTDEGFVTSESGTEKAKPEAGKANVQGKVLYNDKPVEGIEILNSKLFFNK